MATTTTDITGGDPLLDYPTNIDPGVSGDRLRRFINTALTNDPGVAIAIANMTGRIDPTTKQNIWNAAAERGLNFGTDSPLADTAYLNAIGKTSEDLRNLGAEQYRQAYANVPTDILLTEEQQLKLKQEWDALEAKILSGEKLSREEMQNATDIAALNAQTQRDINAANLRATGLYNQQMLGLLGGLMNRQGRASDYTTPWGGRTIGAGLGGGLYTDTGAPVYGNPPSADQGYMYTGAAPSWATKNMNQDAWVPESYSPMGGEAATYLDLRLDETGLPSTSWPQFDQIPSRVESPVGAYAEDFSYFY